MESNPSSDEWIHPRVIKIPRSVSLPSFIHFRHDAGVGADDVENYTTIANI